MTDKQNHQSFAIASIVTMVSGIAVTALALIPGASEPLFALVAAPGTDASINPAATLCAGIVGALMAGWGVSMLSLSRRLDSLDAAVVGSAFTRGALTWFVLDGTVSVATGFAWNVVGNVGFLVVLLLPALALRRNPQVARSA